jgi:hypothetical protein
MTALILLIAALMGFNHWLLEPALQASSDLLELKLLPWLLLALVGWLMAGRSSES